MRDFFLSNLGLKIFSLLLAVLIWVAIQSNLRPERQPTLSLFRRSAAIELRCPITVAVAPSNRQVFKVEPNEVTVKLAGNAAVLGKLTTNDIVAFVKLTDAARLSGLFPVEVKLPPDVRQQDILPAKVNVWPAATN